MAAIEQEIMDKIRNLDEQGKRRVLEFVSSLETGQRPYTARELMRLPFDERTRIAQEALARSQDEDVELFEAYGEADFDDQ
jgi:hypothetical protein